VTHKLARLSLSYSWYPTWINHSGLKVMIGAEYARLKLGQRVSRYPWVRKHGSR
jgi:hypothetical protein